MFLKQWMLTVTCEAGGDARLQRTNCQQPEVLAVRQLPTSMTVLLSICIIDKGSFAKNIWSAITVFKKFDRDALVLHLTPTFATFIITIDTDGRG